VSTGAETGESIYWLVGVEGKARRVRLPISAPLLVGRGASNHVVLDDPRISRQHARFAPQRDGTFLYDLNSANGTIVNGVGITKHRLAVGDVIRFGRYSFRIELAAGEATAPADFETPTLIATESVARMLVARESAGSGERPMVDLTQLQDAYQKLGTLYSFMRAISSTLDRGELLRLIGAKIRDVYPLARSVAVYVRAGKAHNPVYPDIPPSVMDPGAVLPAGPSFQLAHFAGAGIMQNEVMLPDDVSGEILASANALLVGQSFESTRAPGGTDMYAPMVDRGDVLGVIHVSADKGPSFLAADLELLAGMAATAAMMLQNTQTHDESLLRDRLKYDLELAAKIQKSFLPREVISVEGLELFAEYRAAYTIGGDFYDVFWVGDQQLAFFIGDISGKGVAAALLMARISSELRSLALAHVEPVAVLNAMNETILASGQPELFFTAIYLTFDVKTGEVRLANAGHPYPYWCRAGAPFEAVTGGASSAIGILDDPGFTETSLHLAHGDSLVLYTDGVIEAANATGALYGQERLEACLAANPSTRPNEIAERILQSVEEYSTDNAMSDDLTLFICHRAVGRPASLQPRRRSGMLPAQQVTIPKNPGPIITGD
jgi:serine phosphatase RsbU (regulator of sigma subunit)